MKKSCIGFIGLGKMGLPVASRIVKAGFTTYVYDTNLAAITKMVRKGAKRCSSVADVVQQLPASKVLMLCVPAGKLIDEMIKTLLPELKRGDVLIDLGNSFFKDSQHRAKMLKKKGIYFIDVGMSGGVDGATNGACLMIGGSKLKVTQLREIFKAISLDGSYQYMGDSGAGHFVKGFHNLIEYGYLQSLAEGLDSIQRISKKQGFNIDLKDVCGIWNQGSIIESRLVGDAREALQTYKSLKGISGSVIGQTASEMKLLVKEAQKVGVNIYSCNAAIKARLDSQKRPTQTGKIINATRNIFGGHKEWKKP